MKGSKLRLLSYLTLTLFLCHQACADDNTDSYAVTTTINFNNLTHSSLVQTQDPYLDNYSNLSSFSRYRFVAPKKTISPNEIATTILSYYWSHNWYGVSQFAYNYAGRSKDYGCFITEMRLSWVWGGDYHIVISSYRKDPDYPNDYLICHAKSDAADNTFTVDFISSQDKNAEKENQLDDMNRYDLAGDSYELAHTSYFYINKPITLNPVLSLYPDHNTPEQQTTTSSELHTNSANVVKLTVINHASLAVESGSVLLDKFSKFNDQYYYDQPASILPEQTGTIVIGTPYLPGDFDLERFSYRFKGYSEQSGCFITSSKRWVSETPVASFYFDSNYPQKNLYCLVTAPDTIEIYDDPELTQLSAHGCTYENLKTCISTHGNFYKDGDRLKGEHYKYDKLPLSPDPSHYLMVSPGGDPIVIINVGPGL